MQMASTRPESGIGRTAAHVASIPAAQPGRFGRVEPGVFRGFRRSTPTASKVASMGTLLPQSTLISSGRLARPKHTLFLLRQLWLDVFGANTVSTSLRMAASTSFYSSIPTTLAFYGYGSGPVGTSRQAGKPANQTFAQSHPSPPDSTRSYLGPQADSLRFQSARFARTSLLSQRRRTTGLSVEQVLVNSQQE